MKKVLILTSCLLLMATVAFGTSTTDWLLQRGFANQGLGVVTWNNATGVQISSVYGTGTNTFAITTDEAVTVISAYGDTQPMMNITVINASAATAMAGTITWSSGDLLTINAGLTTTQAKTTDCTGITLTACVTAANAFTWTETNTSVTAAAGALFIDNTYTDYYEPEAASNLAAIDFTVAAGGTKTITPVAMATSTFFDSSSLDFTGKTIDYFKTTMEAMYGGTYFTVTIADGFNSDLASGMDDVANLGAGNTESPLAMPFTAAGAAIDYLEEDRYKSIGYVSTTCNFTTACNLRILDGDTIIWSSAALTDDTRTTFSFNPVITSRFGNYLTVQLYSADTIATVTDMYVIGRTD